MLLLAAIIGASVAASFTDWLFMDVIIHRFYERTPAVWQRNEGAARIVGSMAIGTMSSASAVLLSMSIPPAVPGHGLLLALALWCAGPLPVLAQNWLWIGMHPAVVAGHAAGWLARLAIACVLSGWLLPR